MGFETKGINEIEFDKIFNTMYGAIRNFVYYKTSDMQLAEDVAQDTFLKVWEKKEQIRPETVKALLYRIAGNLLINRYEHSQVTMKYVSNYISPTESVTPLYELELKEFDQQLQAAIAGLDEKKRTVFLMNRIDELTYKEIADNLGLTVKAIEKRMEKALSFLRGKMNVKL
jgi:RNA polymerase sigma-70 factor (family 1)